MKNLVSFITALVFGFQFSNAQLQTCDCKTDLDFVVEKLQKMPSYKKQIKGEKETLFNETYDRISKQMTTAISIEACYQLILEQTLVINDVHMGLSVNSVKKQFSSPKSQSNDKIKSIAKIEIVIDDLKSKPVDSPEGIYKHNNERIGLYYADNQKDLYAVVLDTDLENWKTGEIRFTLTHTNNKKYNMYYYNVKNRKPGFVKSLTLENGRIWNYKKEGNTNNFELPDTDETATFKEIDSNIQYLSFKNFSNSNFKWLKKFYKNTKDKLTTDNIIVDLRGNSGGNSKLSDPFLKDLKNKNVYVITNSFTGSNGEQFTVKLLKNKNAIHLGQTTFGSIAYGFNYGTSYTLPSGNFKITPTDMNFHNAYFEFEGKGITPDVKLDFNKDWMQQTLNIIASKNQ